MKVGFMIIGAMKCGTSTLAGALGNHPDVCFSRPKEPNFFNNDKLWRKHLYRYHKMFRYKEALIYGEGSTSYTKFPGMTRAGICDDLYEYNADLKFIYIIRHPVTRAISHYMHIYQRGFTDLDFSAAIRQTSILDVGNYAMQIEPYIRKFGRDKVHLIKFEEMVANPVIHFREAAEFLGIDPSPLLRANPGVKNQTLGKEVMNIRQEEFFSHYIKPLRPYLPRPVTRGIRRLLCRLNSKRSFREKINISDEDEKYILERSAEGVELLKPLVNFDLTDYLLPPVKG
jgi:hypothetical protein